ncbi:hypothetical protein FHS78_001948 [Parvibaculum indicum]|uniref:hypothetical protein n=1 Tax=Parvibaculum indicum TaxID=562969 RepID=UPI001421EE51|nr:hypothetical protein [Parvibaculum indicum]NIJ41658.1 hypothetical protein [Parvibaculum indicum]
MTHQVQFDYCTYKSGNDFWVSNWCRGSVGYAGHVTIVAVRDNKAVPPSRRIADLVYDRIAAKGAEIAAGQVHAIDLSLIMRKSAAGASCGDDFGFYVDHVKGNFYRFLSEEYEGNFVAFMLEEAEEWVMLSGLVVPLDKSHKLSYRSMFSKEKLGRIESRLRRLMREQGFSSAKRNHDPDFHDVGALRKAPYHETPYLDRLRPPRDHLGSLDELEKWSQRERSRLYDAYEVAANQGRMISLHERQNPEETWPDSRAKLIAGRHPGALPDVLKDLANTEVLEIAIKRSLVDEGFLPEDPVSDEIVRLLIDGVLDALLS